jgi:hypothetical protein
LNYKVKAVSLYDNAINSIGVFVILILAIFYLRNRGIHKPSNAPTLARLITELVLPAYLFRQLTMAHISIFVLKGGRRPNSGGNIPRIFSLPSWKIFSEAY